jgi:class III poly(R)-hydroxyalkanoic acid synthase PhaE subunit
MGAQPQRDPLDRFAQQARQWFGKMQDVAAQFAGRSASAEDVAGAWRQAMGGAGDNPFAAMFAQMQGRGQSGFEQWYEHVAPLLQTLLRSGGQDPAQFASQLFAGARDEARSWLHTPAFGLAREHQERWQALAQAQLDLQDANDGYNALLAQAGRDAFERFERKLAERSEPGRQLQSARALFDLWIDAAEEAYADIALSPEFRRCYAELVNAQMRVRAGVQREVEHMGGLFGMPTRTEIDSAHRKIAELERELRRMRKAFAGESRAPAQRATHAATKAATQAPPARRREPPVAAVATSAEQAEPTAPKPAPAVAAAAKLSPVKTSQVKPVQAKPAQAKPSHSKARQTKPAQTKPAPAKASRAASRAAAKRAARPSIASSIPDAPQPLTAATPKTRKR